jgi:hypothetical protein
VPLIAALLASCDGEAVTLDVGAPVDPAARPVAKVAAWGPSGAIRIVRIGERRAGRRRLLGIGEVKRFFLDRVAWSPDGRRLAFTGESGLGYGRINIWTVDADGGSLRRVTRTGDALSPAWAQTAARSSVRGSMISGVTRTGCSTTRPRCGQSIPTAFDHGAATRRPPNVPQDRP